jgi:hypothetical protein
LNKVVKMAEYTWKIEQVEAYPAFEMQDALGEEVILGYEANVAEQISNQIAPPVVTPPLPWST